MCLYIIVIQIINRFYKSVFEISYINQINIYTILIF